MARPIQGRACRRRGGEIAVQIADALAAAHRAGSSIAISSPPTSCCTKAGSKLLDFGLAKAAPCSGAGSVRFCPRTPPQALTARRHDPRHVPVHGARADRRRARPTRAPISSRSVRPLRVAHGQKAFEGKTHATHDGGDPRARADSDLHAAGHSRRCWSMRSSNGVWPRARMIGGRAPPMASALTLGC